MPDCSSPDMARIAEMFKALSNEHRLQIFVRLACCQVEPDSDACDGQVCACVGSLGKNLNLAPSTVSHHLKELARAGLIRMERNGKKVECQADPAAVRLLAGFFQGFVQR